MTRGQAAWRSSFEPARAASEAWTGQGERQSLIVAFRRARRRSRARAHARSDEAEQRGVWRRLRGGRVDLDEGVREARISDRGGTASQEQGKSILRDRFDKNQATTSP